MTNLEAGLRELRGEDATCFWVDSLRIKQKDLVERALQVMRMGLIYSKASQVIVWPSEEADGSNIAMSALK